jgi:DNA-binding NtrC family response regulator
MRDVILSNFLQRPGARMRFLAETRGRASCKPGRMLAERDVYHALIDRIVRTADVPRGAGVRVMRLAIGSCAAARVVEGAARALRALGFAPVSLGVDAAEPRGCRLHRHVVLFGEERDAAMAVAWIRALTDASPRAHLLVLLSGREVQPCGGAPLVRESAPAVPWRFASSDWSDRCARMARRAGACARAGEWDAAEAAIRSLVAEAAVLRLALPDLQARGWADFLWELRMARGRTKMNLLDDLATLFEAVHDAPDEYTALRHGCSWVREHAGADGVAIVAGDAPKVIAGDGVCAADLESADLRAAVGAWTAGGTLVADGARATVVAPMRYGGATIGYACARGAREAAESLDAGARALASACAPALRARLDGLAVSAASHTVVPEMLGRSPSITLLREAIARAAATMFPVLIEGESGTGKELVARALHRLSARRDRRFAAINCAALADDLVEAELFGHSRGAFTGAVSQRAGLFEESHGSTLFLDEIAELSPRAQAKLLRVLQEREVRRVGEHLPRAVDVRVVAATNVPLVREAAAGKFREDLLFRLAVVKIRVPPLRDRIEDVPLLALAFWRSMIGEARKHAVLGPDALAALCRHRWPGNVRELQNVVAGLIVAAPARGRVSARQVEQVVAGYGAGDVDAVNVTLEHARASLERRMIAAALARHRGRRSRAARELGLSRQGLSKAMRRLGFDAARRRASAAVRHLSPQA